MRFDRAAPKVAPPGAAQRPQAKPHSVQNTKAGAPSGKASAGPPVYRPVQKVIVQPKMASASRAQTRPNAPPVYRPQLPQAKAGSTRPTGLPPQERPSRPGRDRPTIPRGPARGAGTSPRRRRTGGSVPTGPGRPRSATPRPRCAPAPSCRPRPLRGRAPPAASPPGHCGRRRAAWLVRPLDQTVSLPQQRVS